MPQKLKSWILLVGKNYAHSNVDLTFLYPNHLNRKIEDYFKLTNLEKNFLIYCSTISYYDFKFIQKFMFKNDLNIVEISTGFGRMLPFFLNSSKNYYAYEPIRETNMIVNFFNKIFLDNQFMVLTNQNELNKKK